MERVDRYFLAFAYILLVVIVAGMGWWIGHELNTAEDERCSLARAQLLLSATEALALERAAPADFKDDVANAVIEAYAEIQGVCDIQIEPTDLFDRLRDSMTDAPPTSTP